MVLSPVPSLGDMESGKLFHNDHSGKLESVAATTESFAPDEQST